MSKRDAHCTYMMSTSTQANAVRFIALLFIILLFVFCWNFDIFFEMGLSTLREEHRIICLECDPQWTDTNRHPSHFSMHFSTLTQWCHIFLLLERYCGVINSEREDSESMTTTAVTPYLSVFESRSSCGHMTWNLVFALFALHCNPYGIKVIVVQLTRTHAIARYISKWLCHGSVVNFDTAAATSIAATSISFAHVLWYAIRWKIYSNIVHVVILVFVCAN